MAVNRFSVGDTVYCIGNSNVRANPAISDAVIGVQVRGIPGTVLTVTEETSTKYVFYEVNFTSGVDGWVAGQRLMKDTAGFGAQTWLLMRAKFSDEGSVTLPTDTDLNNMGTASAASFAQYSLGQMSMDWDIVTGTVTLPSTMAHYTGLSTDRRAYEFMEDSHAGALALGFNWQTYQQTVVWTATGDVMVNNELGWSVPWSIVTSDYGLLGFGHDRFGMINRANAWLTTSNQQFGACNACGGPDPSGIADNYDVIGAEQSRANFNLFHKNQGPRWIPDANIQTVSANGVYRIYAHDTETAFDADRKYGLRVPGHSASDYWVEYREDGPAAAGVSAGLVINWGGLLLLDMHPATSAFTDAALSVGETFTDPDARFIRFTTGGSTPKYADVVVSLDGQEPTSVIVRANYTMTVL